MAVQGVSTSRTFMSSGLKSQHCKFSMLVKQHDKPLSNALGDDYLSILDERDYERNS